MKDDPGHNLEHLVVVGRAEDHKEGRDTIQGPQDSCLHTKILIQIEVS